MLKDRKAYDTVTRLGGDGAFSPIARSISGAIGEYYEADSDAHGCAVDLVRERIIQRLTNSKHEQSYREYFSHLEGDVSVSNVIAHVAELHRRHIGGKLSLALANGAPQAEVDALIAEYSKVPAESQRAGTESLVDVLDTTDLIEGKENVQHIRMWPKALNDRLDGGALRGHHILVYARPETGKTLFAINLCAGFLHQRLNVLYVGNEEPVADVRDRVRARLLKITKGDVRRDGAAVARRLAQVQLGSLHIAGGVGTFRDVRKLLARDKYDVVILDQLRNLRMSGDSKTENLEEAAKGARELAKDYNALVVSVTQAGDSATDKVYLRMSDVDSSKTGIPGAVDLMIGIGADEGMKLNGLLGVSLPKNKLSGIHDKFTVTANYLTGVIE